MCSLAKILQRDTGRKYFIIVGLSHLRIRRMLICLIEANRKISSMQPCIRCNKNIITILLLEPLIKGRIETIKVQ
jgi:hypothetical protein